MWYNPSFGWWKARNLKSSFLLVASFLLMHLPLQSYHLLNIHAVCFLNLNK